MVNWYGVVWSVGGFAVNLRSGSVAAYSACRGRS